MVHKQVALVDINCLNIIALVETNCLNI